VLGAKAGSLGAVNGTIKNPGALAGVFADHAIRLIGNGTTGANKDGFHLRHVNVVRDLAVTKFGDFRRVRPGEPDPKSGQPLQVRRGIEVGHIFKLGVKYSEAMKALFLDEAGAETPFVMGCYGLGVTRTVAAAIEQHHDADGIRWPRALAPFDVLLVPLSGTHAESLQVAEDLYAALRQAGVDVLLDDRDLRPGGKFKDADLIGIPTRVTIGERGLNEDKLEIRDRQTGTVTQHPRAQLLQAVLDAVRSR
jgi:prolyl-tRNA synthetase